MGERKVLSVQKAGVGSPGERRVGRFQGTYASVPGQGGYWAGIYGYSVSDGDCRASYHHGRDDAGFEPAILMSCEGPCWQ